VWKIAPQAAALSPRAAGDSPGDCAGVPPTTQQQPAGE
jgi:hypothetical protein